MTRMPEPENRSASGPTAAELPSPCINPVTGHPATTSERKRQCNNNIDDDDDDDEKNIVDRLRFSRNRRRRRQKPKLDPINDTIVVIGAGLAGLSTCLALENAGFMRIKLYERDGDFDRQREGYGLTLTYNTKGPLAKLGVLETVAQHDCPSRSHYMFLQQPREASASSSDTSDAADAAAAIPIGYFGNAFYFSPDCQSVRSGVNRGRGQRGNLRVPRKTLRRILLDSLKTTKIYWGHSLLDFEFQLHEANPETDSLVETTDKVEVDTIDEQKSGCQHQAKTTIASESAAEGGHYRLIFQRDTDETGDIPSNGSNTVVEYAQFLVAADGIRSRILKKLYDLDNESGDDSNRRTKSGPLSTMPFLRSLNIRLILGIADFDHPLLTERGFYTFETQNGIRLFTMPYLSNRFDDKTKQQKRKNRVMWQLSFPTSFVESEDRPALSDSLYSLAMNICKRWHSPVLDMIQATPLETVWGTELMDRDPSDVLQLVQRFNHFNDRHDPRSHPRDLLSSRLAIVGDALHPMSCFKGQGANQALADGPLLAKWLQQSSIDAAWKGWWRETVARTAPIVEASRIAAHDLHNVSNHPDGTNKMILTKEYHDFAGVDPVKIPELVQILHNENIGPQLSEKLDERIREVIQRNHFFAKDGVQTSCAGQTQKEMALTYSSNGDTQGLRQMSLNKQNCAILEAREDGTDRDCLQLAALNGHLHTCKWLLTELRMPVSTDLGARTDAHFKMAIDYANESGIGSLKHLFSVIADEEKKRD